MAVITLPFVFVNGTIAQAAQVNADFSTIATDYNGNITNANIAANAAIDLTKLANLGTVAGCRLTATSGVPITSTDVTAASNIYVTPYLGGMVPLYNGTQWSLYNLSEITIPLTGLSTNVIYDVYITLSAGVPVAAPLQTWTGNTPPTRALLNGFTVLAADHTQLLVGSIGATSSTTTEDSIANRYVSNVFNAVPRPFLATDTTASWTYASATVRAAHGTSTPGVGAVYFVASRSYIPVVATLWAAVTPGTSGESFVGIGVTSTTAFTTSVVSALAVGTYTVSMGCSYSGEPGLGLNYLQRLEAAGAGTNTYYGSLSPGAGMNGLSGWILG